MQNLVNLPEFDYGYPAVDNSWYGLWCPLLDCFVLVSGDFYQLRKIQELTVSKILTVLVKLDGKLHQENIIDNSCACDWTLEDIDSVHFTLAFLKTFHQESISQIQPSMLRDPEQVNNIQVWFMFVWRWIKYLDGYYSQNFVQTPYIAFDGNFNPPVQQKIYQILILEHDITEAEKQITDYLNSNV